MDHEVNTTKIGFAVCPHCHARFDKPLPIEPVWTINEAAWLIPMTQGAMRSYLSRHSEHFPHRRYTQGRDKILRRMLTASEIRYIRSKILKFKGPDGKYREATPYGE